MTIISKLFTWIMRIILRFLIFKAATLNYVSMLYGYYQLKLLGTFLQCQFFFKGIISCPNKNDSCNKFKYRYRTSVQTNKVRQN